MPKGKGKRSRKGKKDWRRNVNVQDEEDFGRLKETSDSQLFVVDKPSKQIPIRSKKDRKKLISDRPLYSDKFTTPIGKNKVENIQKKTETNRYIQRISDNLEKQKNKTVIQPEKQSEPITNKDKQNGFFDLWGAEDIQVNKKVVKRNKTLKDSLPSSELTKVLPGQSYHPSQSDHQELLKAALDQITEKVDPEMRASQKLKPTKPKQPDVEVKWNYSSSEEDDEEEEEKEDRSNDFDSRIKEINRHYSTKFTTTQRNKLKRKKNEMLKRKRAKEATKPRNIDR